MSVSSQACIFANEPDFLQYTRVVLRSVLIPLWDRTSVSATLIVSSRCASPHRGQSLSVLGESIFSGRRMNVD